MITVKNIFKSYHHAGSSISVLKNMSFTVEKAKTLAVTGSSGSGKTTLLSLLAGLELPDRGDIIIDGENIVSMDESQRTQFRLKNVGIVFQQYHLMPYLTALENVSLPLEIAKQASPEEKAKQQLEKVGLSHRWGHLPSQLSGGECQRVAIARAISAQPKILFADEPSGNLDRISSEVVMDILFSLVQEDNMTMILVTHNVNLSKRCHDQISLER